VGGLKMNLGRGGGDCPIKSIGYGLMGIIHLLSGGQCATAVLKIIRVPCGATATRRRDECGMGRLFHAEGAAEVVDCFVDLGEDFFLAVVRSHDVCFLQIAKGFAQLIVGDGLAFAAFAVAADVFA